MGGRAIACINSRDRNLLGFRRDLLTAAACTASDPAFAGVSPWRIGVAAALRPLPGWKRTADFIFSQVSYSVWPVSRPHASRSPGSATAAPSMAFTSCP